MCTYAASRSKLLCTDVFVRHHYPRLGTAGTAEALRRGVGYVWPTGQLRARSLCDWRPDRNPATDCPRGGAV